jgi:hypothetical protein
VEVQVGQLPRAWLALSLPRVTNATRQTQRIHERASEVAKRDVLPANVSPLSCSTGPHPAPRRRCCAARQSWGRSWRRPQAWVARCSAQRAPLARAPSARAGASATRMRYGAPPEAAAAAAAAAAEGGVRAAARAPSRWAQPLLVACAWYSQARCLGRAPTLCKLRLCLDGEIPGPACRRLLLRSGGRPALMRRLLGQGDVPDKDNAVKATVDCQWASARLPVGTCPCTRPERPDGRLGAAPALQRWRPL